MELIKYDIVDSGNGLVPNNLEAIVWAKFDQAPWQNIASPGSIASDKAAEVKKENK